MSQGQQVHIFPGLLIAQSCVSARTGHFTFDECLAFRGAGGAVDDTASEAALKADTELFRATTRLPKYLLLSQQTKTGEEPIAGREEILEAVIAYQNKNNLVGYKTYQNYLIAALEETLEDIMAF